MANVREGIASQLVWLAAQVEAGTITGFSVSWTVDHAHLKGQLMADAELAIRAEIASQKALDDAATSTDIVPMPPPEPSDPSLN